MSEPVSLLFLERQIRTKLLMMKKIIYNDNCGLTQLAVSGKKTLTSRIEPGLKSAEAIQKVNDNLFIVTDADGNQSEFRPRLKKGEIVAIAMNYQTIGMDHLDPDFFLLKTANSHNVFLEDVSSLPGWKNKMFVKAELMPYRQEVVDIHIERLSDINDEDCIKEGIEYIRLTENLKGYGFFEADKKRYLIFETPQKAFKRLIEKTCGRKIWKENPFVVRYQMKRISKNDRR